MTLSPVDVGVLLSGAFATAVLSAIVGMAGGIVLLSVMLLYLDPMGFAGSRLAQSLPPDATRALVGVFVCSRPGRRAGACSAPTRKRSIASGASCSWAAWWAS